MSTDAHAAIRRVIERLPGVNAGATTEAIEASLSDAGLLVVSASLVADTVAILRQVGEYEHEREARDALAALLGEADL